MRSRRGATGPGGPSSGLNRVQTAIVIMNSAVSSRPGRKPASSSRPIDSSVRIA